MEDACLYMADERLYVKEFGHGQGPSIVFLHGGGLSGRMWQPQIERLPNFHCVVPDLPEQGRSAHIAPFLLEDTARRVEALIEDHCEGGRAHLVGLSLGGAVALTVMRRRPELLHRVVISGAAAGMGRFVGAVSKWSAAFYRWLDTETIVKLSVKQFRIPDGYVDMLRDDMAVGATEAFARHVADALMSLQLPTDTSVPLLVAVGERETRFAKQSARKIVETVPGARGVMAPAAGHVWNLEKPELFAHTVRAWCEDKPLPTELRAL